MTSDERMIAGQGFKQEDRLEIVMEILEVFTRLWHERVGDEVDTLDLIRLLRRDENTANMLDHPMNYTGNLMLLILGGNDTTFNSMSGDVLFLSEFPEEFARVKADRSLIPLMVSEIIRFQTPLFHMQRTVTRDTDFRLQHMKAGDKVILWYCSANRDESLIPELETFQIYRSGVVIKPHLALGSIVV